MDAALLHTVWYGAVNHSCGWSCTAIQRRIPSFHVGHGNASPKCHFVTYSSHFRVLGKRAKISVLNRGKRDLEIGNFDYWR